MKSWSPVAVGLRLGLRLGVALGAVLGVALGAGCGRELRGGTKDGRAVFETLCASCHGADGRPPAAMVSRLGVRDLTAPEFRARVTASQVEQQVRAGSTSRLMPSFAGVIDDVQIKAVATYVASQRFLAPR